MAEATESTESTETEATETSESTETTEATETTESTEPTETKISDSKTSLIPDDDEDETTETEEGEPELLAGKYKTPEDLVKAYENLSAKLRERGDALDDDTLKAIAQERGFAPKDVPEKYENLDKIMTEAGMEPSEYEENKEVWDEFTGTLKELGLNQQQAEGVIKIGAKWAAAQVASVGADIDVDAEGHLLAQEWGNKSVDRIKSVGKWAKANLPGDVLKKPLHRTAEGLKFLDKMMREKSGPVPIVDTDTPTADPTALDNEITEAMKSEAYLSPHHKDHEYVHQQVEKKLEKLRQMRGAR